MQLAARVFPQKKCRLEEVYQSNFHSNVHFRSPSEKKNIQNFRRHSYGLSIIAEHFVHA